MWEYFLNIPMTTPILQKIGFGLCAKRGPQYGKNQVAKDASLQFAEEFMIRHLK